MKTRLVLGSGMILLAAVAVGCGGEGDVDDASAGEGKKTARSPVAEEQSDEGEQFEHESHELVADTSLLHQAAFNSNRTIITMCWQDSAYIGGDWQPYFDAARAEVEAAIANSWDAVSWVDVQWLPDCNNGGIPVTVEDSNPRASTDQAFLNFTFGNFATSCQPTSTTDANWLYCLRANAIHEFGHVLGMDHEQNRGNPSGIQCTPGSPTDVAHEDVGEFSITGDLDIGKVADPDSVLAYCGWSDTLSAGDIDGIQRIYGGEGRHVQHNDYLGVRTGAKYIGINTNNGMIYEESLDTAFRIERLDGAGSVHYGDVVALAHGNKYLCSTTGIGTAHGTVQPYVSWRAGSPSNIYCGWTVEHTEGEVGGNTVDISDPMYLHHQGPPGTSSDMHADIPYNGRLSVRFMGPFPPL